MNLLERGHYLIGFRPENFLPKEVLNGQENLETFSFNVGRVEYLGSDRLLYGLLSDAVGDGRTIAKLPSTVTLPIEPGHSYEFVVQAQHLKFFDKTTGLRTEPESV
jgi:multiple sugar transport system ATP-binding protein